MSLVAPGEHESVLDVGASDSTERMANFLEAWYPWPHRITVVSRDPVPVLRSVFSQPRYVRGDGRRLPFGDKQFDIGFANAVIEHVGTRDQQRVFAAELFRTCRRMLITTPNRSFPVDPHTLYPFLHWLPAAYRGPVYRRLGKEFWSHERNLNPLTERAFTRVLPPQGRIRVVRQRILGLVSTLTAVVDDGTAPMDAHPSERLDPHLP